MEPTPADDPKTKAPAAEQIPRPDPKEADQPATPNGAADSNSQAAETEAEPATKPRRTSLKKEVLPDPAAKPAPEEPKPVASPADTADTTVKINPALPATAEAAQEASTKLAALLKKPLEELTTDELTDRTARLDALALLKNKERELAKNELDDRLAIQDKQHQYLQKLLAITGGHAPKLFSTPGESLKEVMNASNPLALDSSLPFDAVLDALRAPELTSIKLDATSDFFGMNSEDKVSLYKRIGLFKGIVIDHRQEDPAEQGFRDVLKFDLSLGRAGQPAPASVADPTTKDKPANSAGTTPTGADKAPAYTEPVGIFYRKPRLAGFFESTYATDEFQSKTQKAGIYSLSVGGSLSVSAVASVNVKGGFSKSEESLAEAVRQTKEVTITTSFFLPKIELSFDVFTPCASDDFVRAVERVFQLRPEERFDHLLDVLQQFGHFVATNLVVGGRLYTSEEKKATTSKDLKNELKQNAQHLQAAVQAWRVTAGVQVDRAESATEKEAAASTTQNQQLEMRAVGGEGAYVHNTAEWIRSLTPYSAWGVVRFDKLVPSLLVLPAGLAQQCHALLTEVVASPNVFIESLLDKNAHFLFYQGYLEKYGSRVRPRYFVLKGSGPERRVLTIVNGDRQNDTEVALKPYEGTPHQEWWLAPDGKIHARNDPDDLEQFVLSVGGTANDKLVITQENYFPNQRWQLGGGLLRNEALERYVAFSSTDALSIVDEATIRKSRNVWQALTSEQLDRPRPAKVPRVVGKAKGTRVVVLYNDQYLDDTQQLVSSQETTTLSLKGNKLVISQDEETLWTKELGPADSQLTRLYLKGGRLFVADKTDKADKPERPYYLYGDAGTLAGRGESLELLDNGNLELLDQNGSVVWESHSIVYSVLQQADGQGVLSVHHTDFEPNMSYGVIRLTTMPFIGADHQLWYFNRNRQLICKAQRAHTGRMAVTCASNGLVSVEPLNYADRAQRWLVSAQGYGPILNEQWRQKALAPAGVGCILNASDNAQANWNLVPQPAYKADKSYRLEMRFTREDATHQYLHLSEYNSNFIHLHQFPLANDNGARQLRGLQFIVYKENAQQDYGSRLALLAQVASAGELNSTKVESRQWNGDGLVEGFDKMSLFFDKAPVYLPDDLTALGFYKKANTGNKKHVYAIKGHYNQATYLNEDNERALEMLRGINYLDTALVACAENERVVGAGFTVSRTYPDRLAPYLLVIKTT